MKTTCWYEERRNLVGVFDFRSFHRFFVLVARWRWACFVLTSLFCVFFCFHCQGRILFLNCQTAVGRGQLGCFARPRPSAVLFVGFCWCVVLCCMFFFLVALHLYIWGNIVLNTCMAFVVIKIVSLVSLFVSFVNVNVVFNKIVLFFCCCCKKH